MRLRKTDISGIKLFAASVTYSLALVFAYVRFAYEDYSYLGFQLNDSASMFHAVILAIVSSLFCFLLPKAVNKPSHLLGILTYLLVYIPTVNVGYFSISHPSYSHAELVLMYSACMLILLCVPRLGSQTALRTFGLNAKLFWGGSLFITLICTGVVMAYYRTDFSSLFSLQDISALYDIRFEYRETGRQVPALVQYMFAWLVKFFWPLVLVIGLDRNSKPLIFFSFFGFLSLLATSGHKSIILEYFLVLGFWFIWRKGVGASTGAIIKFALCISVSAILLEYVGISVLLEVIIRRSMLIPGLLSSFYQDFFTVNHKAALGYSVLSGLVDYPYATTPPFVIGEYYFGRSEMSANANFIAAGFAEFGVIGSIGVALIAATVYRVLDLLARSKKSFRISTALAVAPSWALVDTSLFTVLLTHGLLLLIVTLYISPNERTSNPRQVISGGAV